MFLNGICPFSKWNSAPTFENYSSVTSICKWSRNLRILGVLHVFVYGICPCGKWISAPTFRFRISEVFKYLQMEPKFENSWRVTRICVWYLSI